MFLLTRRPNGAAPLAHMLRELGVDARIHEVSFPSEFSLHWARTKASDNLHGFTDGVVIGKLSFGEPDNPRPIQHVGALPTDIHPLLHSFVIRRKGTDLVVRPTEQAVAYASGDSVSDFQLLIGRLERHRPGMIGAALLGTMGYFPGNLTLFDDVRKIPYLEELRLPGGATARYSQFAPRPPNDSHMIERLLEITPDYPHTSIALSGGLDSRFVLSILTRKGLRPRAYNLSGWESAIASEVARTLDLDFVTASEDPPDPYRYTLATDARIYVFGGNFGRMIPRGRTHEILHNGLWSDPIIENAMRSAWKRPGRIGAVYEDLIWFGLLGNTPERVTGLARQLTRRQLHEHLVRELEFGKSYTDFATRKQWAGWFYHIHRGINWTNAAMADAALKIYPVYVLGEKEAIAFGIASSAYSNFYKERLRRLNRQLLPSVAVDYSGGRPFHSLPPVIGDAQRISYEFGSRLVRRFQTRRATIRSSTDGDYSEHAAVGEQGFEYVFSADLPDLLKSPTTTRIKRAAITMNHALRFLNAQEAAHTGPPYQGGKRGLAQFP